MSRALALLVTLACTPFAIAHVRLAHPSNNTGLHWSSPSNVKVVIQSEGSDDVADLSDRAALRNAIDAWNAITGTDARLIEETSPSKQARTDWESNSIHLLYFDEDDESGFFPLGSGIVAVTPVWFGGDGEISDADVLFNGRGYSFTTEPGPGAFDIADVATHELGHLLGLDHTGWAGGTMYPYVSPLVIEHRSVSQDEVHGLRHAYPSQTFATIVGTVKRSSDGSTVAGAHVVATDTAGRTRASALANGVGKFTLRGLDPDAYLLYATPFDHPVASWNLSSGQTVVTNFQATYGPLVNVVSATPHAIGDLLVNQDASLSLGRNNDRLPLRGVAGQTDAFVLRGAGLDATCTLSCSDPTIDLAPIAWMGTMVALEIDVPANAPNGHADLIVTNTAGELAVLPAAIEITPPDPVVASTSSSLGSSVGGFALTISGSGFLPGARVELGGEVYVDGQGDCEVLDAATIELVTRATPAGVYDVVVIDPSGEEGRLIGGYQFASIPVVQTVFPASGSALGGTELSISGSSFVDGLEVRIDGVTQTQVTVESASVVRVITESGVAGGPYVVEVENPGGQLATTVFSYSASADPTLAAVTPGEGATRGGTDVTLIGIGFTPTTTVLFGADPVTGLGGVPASAVAFVDASTLVATTPAASEGAASVLVLDTVSGQADVLASAFTFEAPESSGGGGCHTLPIGSPRDPRAPFEALGPAAIAAAIYAFSRRRARAA